MEITLQKRQSFTANLYQKTILSKFAIRKMKLEGNWCTEDIDNVTLQLRVSSATKSFFKLSNERYVFLEREKEISRKENELTFKD